MENWFRMSKNAQLLTPVKQGVSWSNLLILNWQMKSVIVLVLNNLLLVPETIFAVPQSVQTAMIIIRITSTLVLNWPILQNFHIDMNRFGMLQAWWDCSMSSSDHRCQQKVQRKIDESDSMDGSIFYCFKIITFIYSIIRFQWIENFKHSQFRHFMSLSALNFGLT